jgi:hypothetical protein
MNDYSNRFYYSFRILCKFHWYPVGDNITCDVTYDDVEGCLKSGNDVLVNLSMPEIDILPSDIGGLLSLIVLYHLIAFFLLRLKIRQ